MIFRETRDDKEAKSFAEKLGYVESMEKERWQGSIMHPDKAQMVIRRMGAFGGPGNTSLIGVVVLFGGYQDQKENGWMALVCDEIKVGEMQEATETMQKILAGLLVGTEQLSPDDLFNN